MESLRAVVRSWASVGNIPPTRWRVHLLCGPVLLVGIAGPAPIAAQEANRIEGLPESPDVLLQQRLADGNDDHAPAFSVPPGSMPQHQPNSALPLCDPPAHTSSPEANASAMGSSASLPPCRNEQPVQPIVSTRQVAPLSPRQKGELALRDTVDPFNLLTIVGYSAFAVAANSHSAYGPGFEGWGKLSGYSFVEDAQGEFFGTFLVSSLAHEDPRYHRLPQAPVKRRILHAIAHTWVTQHDDGSRMPNYATLLTYPFSAELSNLYVPGVPTNLPSTAKRVGIGLASDPSGTLVAEFLPDIARRIHIHVIFIQEILNQVVTGGTAPNVQ